jgi:hypothetical protein
MVPVLVGTVIALALGWLGLNDWRFPWVNGEKRPGQPKTSAQGSKTADDGAAAPVRVALHRDGGVDVRWSVVKDPELHGYSLYVQAVRPLEYEYSVPRYAGDSDVTERLYPGRYLNKLLAEAADPRRVKPGQVWNVCVQGMEETPPNTPIDDYILPGTKACSEDFRLK